MSVRHRQQPYGFSRPSVIMSFCPLQLDARLKRSCTLVSTTTIVIDLVLVVTLFEAMAQLPAYGFDPVPLGPLSSVANNSSALERPINIPQLAIESQP